MCVGRGCVCPAWLESTEDQRFAVSFQCRSFPGARVSPWSTLPYDNNRRAVIALFILFYFISHHNLSRESGNSLDQIQISRESRLLWLIPNDDPPMVERFFSTTRPHWRGTFLDGNATKPSWVESSWYWRWKSGINSYRKANSIILLLY